jgi:hypothetical protein
VNEFVIERWRVEGGQLTLVLERRTDWFVSWERYEGPIAVVRPPPTVHAVWEDGARRLWVAIHVADSEWRRSDFEARPGDMVRSPRAAKHRLLDTIVEVIDVQRGVLLASQRFDEVFQTVVNGQPFVTYEEDETGHPTYKVWRFRLTQTGGGP